MLSSIKAKIILFYMAVLFVILSVLGVSLYYSLGKIVYDSIDSSLLSRAKALATLVNSDKNETEFSFSDEIMWEYNSPKSKIFFQIRRFDGTTLEKSTSLREGELPFPGKEQQTSFKTVIINSSPARLIDFHAPDENYDASKGKAHSLIIQCAEDIQDQINLLKNYRIILTLSVLSILIISASGGFIIAHKALTPLIEISETIDRISESNLSERVTAGHIPEELRPLASSFNLTFDKLERSFNRQRQFTADASHELRTPLSVILSQSEIALRKERTAEEYKSSLDAIMQAARTMTSTVRKLLTLASFSADKVALRLETIHIKELMNDVAKLLGPLAEQKGIGIETSQIPASLLVQGDRASLLELFANVLDNAIKYNFPQGQVHISARKETEFIVCEIRDTGIGIPSDALEKVFDRFYRVDHSRSKEIDGSGLGLSICREIARLHGGKVEIRSKEGEGTVLSVYLKGRDMQRSSE